MQREGDRREGEQYAVQQYARDDDGGDDGCESMQRPLSGGLGTRWVPPPSSATLYGRFTPPTLMSDEAARESALAESVNDGKLYFYS